jgi:hypothetical protein
MCFAMHALPDQQLLDAHVDYRRHGVYSIKWIKRQLRFVPAGNTCAVWLTGRELSMLPLPKQLDSTDAPYGIAYDFWLRESNSSEHYTTIAAFYGFVVVTLPSHDMQRSSMFASLGNPTDALLHADRALLSLAQHTTITNDVERLYTRFAKLRNLAIDQHSTPEGLLASQRALASAQKCYALLTK